MSGTGGSYTPGVQNILVQNKKDPIRQPDAAEEKRFSMCCSWSQLHLFESQICAILDHLLSLETSRLLISSSGVHLEAISANHLPFESYRVGGLFFLTIAAYHQDLASVFLPLRKPIYIGSQWGFVELYGHRFHILPQQPILYCTCL